MNDLPMVDRLEGFQKNLTKMSSDELLAQLMLTRGQRRITNKARATSPKKTAKKKQMLSELLKELPPAERKLVLKKLMGEHK